jgi:hypothetical protein
MAEGGGIRTPDTPQVYRYSGFQDVRCSSDLIRIQSVAVRALPLFIYWLLLSNRPPVAENAV